MLKQTLASFVLLVALATTSRADPVVDFYRSRVLRANWQGSLAGCVGALSAGGLSVLAGAGTLDAGIIGSVSGVAAGTAWTHFRLVRATIYLSLLEFVFEGPRSRRAEGSSYLHALWIEIGQRARKEDLPFPSRDQIRDYIVPFHQGLLRLDPKELPADPVERFVDYALTRWRQES